MSKRRKVEWHPWVLAAGAMVGLGFFLYILKPQLDATMQQKEYGEASSQQEVRIEKAYFDYLCTVHILHTDGSVRLIETDHKKVNRNAHCYLDKWILLSPDKEYVVFEGADWHTRDPGGYNPGNYMGMYFASNKELVQWNFGSANVEPPSFDNKDVLSFKAVYEGDPFVLEKKISLSFIEDHFVEAVNPQTREIRLIEGVLQ